MNFSITTRIPQALLMTAVLVGPVLAQSLTEFQNGQVADANAVNANFNAIKTAATNAQATADGAQVAASAAQTAAAAVSPLANAIAIAGSNVGIGTASPETQLEVDGDFKIGISDKFYFGGPTENGDPVWMRRLTGAFEESVLQIRIGDDTGNSSFDRFEWFFAGGAQPKFRFNSSGQAFNSTGSWSVLSDARKKKEIESLGGSLDRLMKLRGVTFRYLDPTELGAAPGLRTGFLAQEVETVFPDWVLEQPDGTKTLSISGFEALTVESLRELKGDNDALRVANKSLSADNEDLRQRLEALEQMVAKLQPLLAGDK